ncbi:MAG: glycosyl transferase family 2, partial [Gammaproteobacteria bacterium]|nr:glycosyl transferase family 2 [Gammaproteobacteria bacterium]
RESLDSNSGLKAEIQIREETEKHLRLHESQLELALEEVLKSRSWRITGPIRRIVSLLRKDRGISENSNLANNKTNEHIEKTEAIASQEEKTESAGKRSDAVSQVENTKFEHDEMAKKELEALFRSSKRLVFPKEGDINLSIIVVLYNQAHLGLLCFKSLLDHADVRYELIIIDNASKDRTEDLLARVENAEIIRNDKNLGFLEAVNQGSAIAKGKYMLLLNNDAIIEESSLSNAIHTIDNDTEVGAVGGRIQLIDGTLQEAGSIIWNDGSCFGYGRGENPDDPKFMFSRQVDYCSGAFLLFRKADFIRLGGFDMDFAPAYYEESDFCIRLQKLGLKIVYNPRVKIKHYEFASSGNIADALSLQKRNRGTFLKKHSDWLVTKYAPTQKNALFARSANNFPNILLIDDRVPHPALGSGYPRCSHILNGLASFDYNVTLFPLQFPIDDWRSCYETLNDSIEIILNKGKAGLKDFLRSRAGFFQHIVISRVHNMEVFENIIGGDKSLLENVNIIYDAEALTASREILRKSLHGQYVSKNQQVAMIRGEMDKCRMADSVIAVSKQEAETYRDHGIKNVHVLGHRIVPNPGSNNFIDREGLLFVGALRDDGSPNVDSLLWFCINVLPLIQEELKIKIYVVGDLGASSLFTIQKENISFLGKVKDLNVIYNQCRVFIAPTRFAAGIPHKVHEAAASGIPCVTTGLLAEQLQWTHEKELLIGNTSEKFAAECIRLYRDQRLWEDIRKHGLNAVKEDCSKATFRNNLKSIFS